MLVKCGKEKKSKKKEQDISTGDIQEARNKEAPAHPDL